MIYGINLGDPSIAEQKYGSFNGLGTIQNEIQNGDVIAIIVSNGADTLKGAKSSAILLSQIDSLNKKNGTGGSVGLGGGDGEAVPIA
jgi:hypothetical protein